MNWVQKNGGEERKVLCLKMQAIDWTEQGTPDAKARPTVVLDVEQKSSRLFFPSLFLFFSQCFCISSSCFVSPANPPITRAVPQPKSRDSTQTWYMKRAFVLPYLFSSHGHCRISIEPKPWVEFVRRLSRRHLALSSRSTTLDWLTTLPPTSVSVMKSPSSQPSVFATRLLGMFPLAICDELQ